MPEQLNATTVSAIADDAVARPASEPAMAMATIEGVDMARDTSSGQHKAAEAGHAVRGGQVAKKTVAKKAAAKAAPAAGHARPAGVDKDVLELMAKKPVAGAGMDPAVRGPRSFTLSLELLERLRGITFWGQLANVPEASSGKVSDVAEDILRAGVEAIERKYNGGQPFGQAPEKMPTGPGARGVASLQDYQASRRRKSGDDG